MTDIIKTQQGLARKATVHRDHRFADLYHLLCRREWIAEALQHVLTNDGAGTPGVDGISWNSFNDVQKKDFENEAFYTQFIDQLQAELRTRTFKPLPVRRVEIPKPGKSTTRKLGIPTIKDRVVQMLLKMVLEPIWEADFLYFSNGFRPGRCTMDCIQPLYTLCNTTMKYRWIIEGDIHACFDSIPHDRLVAEVARRIADPHILTLIRRFLKSGVMIAGRKEPTEEGTPQGGIASPLLANIYLHRFDEWFQTHYGTPEHGKDAWLEKRKEGGAYAAAQMYRYADDWIIVVRGTKAQAQAIKAACKQFLSEELGLELSEEKTSITHIHDGFDFLGYRVFSNDIPTDRRRVGIYVQPPDEKVKRVKAKIKEMTDRRAYNDDYLLKIQAINGVIRGWAKYYRAVNAAATFQDLDHYVWFRLSKWLQKKYRLSAAQVRRQFTARQDGPKGGIVEYTAQDEKGRWVWRYRASQTRLVYYRPSYKRNWPNPYLQRVKCEHYVLPTMKT